MNLDEYGKYRLKHILAYGALCAVFLFAVFLLDLETEVVRDRYWKDANPLFNGEIPIMEYPPFALLFMAIPRIFGWTPEAYEVFYVIEVFVFMCIGLIYTDKLAEHFDRSRKKAMLAYSILMILLMEFVADRFDIFPAVLTLVSFYCFVRDRHVLAFGLLSVGMMTKLYPVMILPVYFLSLVAGGQRGEAVRGTAVFALVTLVIVVPVMIVEPEMIYNFFSYHSDRPLQIETVAASLIYPLSVLGLTSVSITSALDPGSFGSDNLVGKIPDIVCGVLIPIMVVCIIAVYATFFLILRRADGNGRLTATGYALVGVMSVFMIFGKVFSSQYLIWVISPIVFVLMFEEDMFRGTVFRLTVAILVFTQINFAYNVGVLHGGSNINDIGMTIILIRNLMVIAFGFLMLRRMIGVGRGTTQID